MGNKNDLTKTDCFAYGIKEAMYSGRIHYTATCDALKKMMCAKGECPFYKNIDLYRADLMARHGTACICDVLQGYSPKSGESDDNGEHC